MMPSTNGHGPKRAILYARVSTDEQARSGFSLAQQLEALREYATREGYEILEEVQDPGQSGASLERPGMDRVRDLVAADGVSMVLAQDRDRFTREPAYHYLLKREFEAYGTQLKALNDRGDDSPEGQLTDGILDQLAKYERAKTAERSRRGKLHKVREGKIVAGPAPAYGFRFNAARDGYKVDQESMAVVRRIFRMIGADGTSLRSVVTALNREGVKLPASTSNKSGRWGMTFVRDHIVKDDLYKPHDYDEFRRFVAEGALSAEVLAKLDSEKTYGVAWFNKGRSHTTQVAVIDVEGRKRYKRQTKFVERPRSEWVAVPVLLGDEAPVPRELVDAAREAIKDNRLPSNAGRRFWELSGSGMLRCALCGGRMAPHSFKKASGRRYYYYRCVKRWQERTCEHGKTHVAKDLEAWVWELVSDTLKDPEQLRADLDTMIEQEKSTGRRADPRREAKAWLEKLAEVDRKRSGYIDLAAEGIMDRDELGSKLAALEETRETAQRELEALQNHQERIAKLEADRDTLLEYYARMTPEALDSLLPEERRKFYGMLRLEVTISPDGSAELRGAAFPEGLVKVCGTNTPQAWSLGPTRSTWRTRVRSSSRRALPARCR
jgi:site-specific DNA recombinase